MIVITYSLTGNIQVDLFQVTVRWSLSPGWDSIATLNGIGMSCKTYSYRSNIYKAVNWRRVKEPKIMSLTVIVNMDHLFYA